MTTPTWKSFADWTGGLCLAILLSACGGGSNPSELLPEPPAPPPPPPGPGTIVEVASETEGFEELVSAIEAAGLA